MVRKFARLLLFFVGIISFFLISFKFALSADVIYRLSVDEFGNEKKSNSNFSSISSDGRYVAFQSLAPLVQEDTNKNWDVYLYGIDSSLFRRISVDESGNQTNGFSAYPSISSNGNYVAFQSIAPLVQDDTNKNWDVYLYDVGLSQITRVSVDEFGYQANGASLSPVISADGNYVAFASSANNLVQNDTNRVLDVFRKNISSQNIERVSEDSSGNQSNNYSNGGGFGTKNIDISSNGRYVVFNSLASNLVLNDTNKVADIFRKDMDTQNIIRVSQSSNQANGASDSSAISADGRYISFRSFAANLVSDDSNKLPDIFRRDILSAATSRVSVNLSNTQANGWSWSSDISGDGRYVVFSSVASNLVGGNKTINVFRKDMSSGNVTRVSTTPSGEQANNICSYPQISESGDFVSFSSFASNLVPDDTNNAWDIFWAIVQDDVPPIAQVTSPVTSGFVSGSAYSIIGTANDLLSGVSSYKVEYKIGASPPVLIKSASYSIVDGELATWNTLSLNQTATYSIILTVTDGAGNSATQTISGVKIDNIVPAASISAPTSGYTLIPTTAISGTASDINLDNWKVEYSNEADPNNWIITTAILPTINPDTTNKTNTLLINWDTNALTSGIYKIRLTVMDKAGNQSTDIITGLTKP